MLFSLQAPEAATSCINKWMNECNSGHGLCKPESALLELPTRVLYIGGTEQVRLHVSNEGQRGRYACLSHCWGGVSIPCTTKLTYLKHQEDIPWNGLPATFQHAIDLSRRLGLQYIWIDSLCIIQDDSGDWRHEGSKMASIYTNSYITLAASASENGNVGLYRTFHDNPLSKFEMQPNSDYSAAYNIYLGQHDHSSFARGTLPLLRRAWVQQERVLSTRVVHFGDTELYWECRATQTCECGEPWRRNVMYKKFDLRRNRGTDEHARADNLRQWEELVREYTRLDITNSSDAFPALQGIATKWQRPAAGNYLAGLWRAELIQCMLWRSKLAGKRPSTYRAPTWSWASIHGAVDWWPDIIKKEHETASILNASTTPVGQDPRGEISAGSITIKGYSIAGRVIEGSHKYYSAGNFVELQVPRDERLIYGWPQLGGGSWYPDLIMSEGTDLEVLLMQMSQIPNNMGGWFTFFIAFKRKRGEEVFYERVGCARADQSDVRRAFRDYGREMVITVV